MTNATFPTRTYSEALGAISNAQLHDGQRNKLWFAPDATLRDWLEPFVSFPIAEYKP